MNLHIAPRHHEPLRPVIALPRPVRVPCGCTCQCGALVPEGVRYCHACLFCDRWDDDPRRSERPEIVGVA